MPSRLAEKETDLMARWRSQSETDSKVTPLPRWRLPGEAGLSPLLHDTAGPLGSPANSAPWVSAGQTERCSLGSSLDDCLWISGISHQLAIGHTAGMAACHLTIQSGLLSFLALCSQQISQTEWQSVCTDPLQWCADAGPFQWIEMKKPSLALFLPAFSVHLPSWMNSSAKYATLKSLSWRCSLYT